MPTYQDEHYFVTIVHWYHVIVAFTNQLYQMYIQLLIIASLGMVILFIPCIQGIRNEAITKGVCSKKENN